MTKHLRNLMIDTLRNSRIYSTDEIGAAFGLTGSQVRRIVRDVQRARQASYEAALARAKAKTAREGGYGRH